MIYEIIQNSDSLKAVTNAVSESAATVQDSVFNSIVFEPSRIIEQGGITISIIGYAVVFAALVILYFFFANVAKVMNYSVKKKLKDEGKETSSDNSEMGISGEVTAAISMALHLHYAEIHDFENTVLTIKKVQRPYSPWSSKLYGLREYPKK